MTQEPLVRLYACGGRRPGGGDHSSITLGLGYLKTNVKGCRIEVVHNPDDLWGADIIGLSADATGTREAVEIAGRAVQESPQSVVVLGGQSTLWPGIIDYPFNWVVDGEGERALQDIVDGQEGGWGKGMDCRGRAAHLEFPLISNLDTLNFPDRGECETVVPLITSRGCPYDCGFCSATKFWCGRVRTVSPGYFIEEIRYIRRRYPDVKQLYVHDDLFASSESRLTELHDAWMSYEHRAEFEFVHAFVRSGHFTRRMADMLVQMNVNHVRFGAESGSQRILDLMGKRTTVENHQKLIDTCNAAGLPVSFNVIRGFPGETPEEWAMTEAFIARNVPHKATISGHYAFRPFPGSALYDGRDVLTEDWRTWLPQPREE